MTQAARSRYVASLLMGATLAFASAAPSFAQGYPNPPQVQTFSGAGQPGCDSSVMAPAMNSAGAYTYTQTYNTTYGLLHQPPSFLSCLQPFLSNSSTNNGLNTFNGNGGLSIGSLLTGLLQGLVTNLMTSISQTVCSQAQGLLNGGAAGGASGGILSYLGNGKNGYPPH